MSLQHQWMMFTIFCIFIIKTVLCKQPHILLFMADDLGWNDLGFHNPDIHSPTLDSLAKNGVQLENYYVQPICAPSRSQLLTGRYQIHTGTQHIGGLHPQPQGLPARFPTLPEKLKDCGYKTHMVGKWHLGFHKEELWPTRRGFDTFYGIVGGMTDFYTHRMCVPVNGVPLCGLDFYNNFEPILDKNGSYATEVYAERVAQLVQDHATDHKKEPLFIYVPFQSPHIPLQVPPKYLQYYQQIENPARKIFSGMVSAIDAAVAVIVDAFKEHGLWDDTLTIFTSDNGAPELTGGNNMPYKGGKASLWEGGIKSVGIVHGYKISKHVKSTNELIHISDWFPTLMKLAKCGNCDEDLDGHDVWKAISKNHKGPRNELLHNIDDLVPLRGTESSCQSFDTRVRAGIRVGKWKLLTGDPNSSAFLQELGELGFPLNSIAFQFPDLTGPGEENKNVWLYDLECDPEETNDLSGENPDKVEELCERLAWYNKTALPAIAEPLDLSSDPANHGDLWTHWLD